MQTFSWVETIGGLAFFFYGLQSARSAFQLIAGGRTKEVLRRVTSNRFKAVGFGALVTLALQSSSATTVMLVSLAGTHLLTLPQSFGVILGADIGTTFVVILLSIKKITDYALLFVAFGFAIHWMTKSRRTKHIGSGILGFGLIFFGMHLMSHGVAPLQNNETALQIFQYLALNPVASLVAATIFTAVVQASAATIGMAISLALAGLLSFDASLPIVLGANIGTCLTAFLGSFGMGTDAKRVAVAHILVKTTGVALAFPFLPYIATGINFITNSFSRILPSFSSNTPDKIAIAHLLFNAAVALLFLPFIRFGVAIVKKLVPEPHDAPAPFAPRYLDEKVLETPVLAFAQVKREVLRVAGYTYDLFKNCLKMFEAGGFVPEKIEEAQEKDDKIDILDTAIRFYLAKLSMEELTGEQAKSQYELFTIAGNLEEIGDIISKDLALLAEKKWNKHAVFSEQGWNELKSFHEHVLENFNLTISAIASPYPEVIQKILRHQKSVYDLQQKYEQAHINRLHEGLKESFETSSIHLDVLSNLRRVSGQLTYIARVVGNNQH